MATLIFDNDVIKKHPIYTHAKSILNDISLRDYGKIFFDSRLECLDLDGYEASLRYGANESTMDAAIGVALFDSDRKKQAGLLMVELRMGYKSTKHLSSSSLNRKVSHSMELLSSEICTYADYVVFIFSDSVFQQALRWTNDKRHSNTSGKEWRVMSPRQFNETYLCEEDLPYHPKHDFEHGKQMVQKMLDEKLCYDLYDTLDEWSQELCRWSYSLQESECITNFVQEVWAEIVSRKNELDSDGVELLNLFVEDNPVFGLLAI